MPEPIEIRTPFVLDFTGNDHRAGDFRPKMEKVEEEADPKDSFAPELVPSLSSEPTGELNPVPSASAAKVSGLPKAEGPGKLTLPPVTSPGKNEQTATG